MTGDSGLASGMAVWLICLCQKLVPFSKRTLTILELVASTINTAVQLDYIRIDDSGRLVIVRHARNMPWIGDFGQIGPWQKIKCVQPLWLLCC